MRILIICTGNSCRSQMAEGWLKSFDSSLIVKSAGTIPAEKVSSKAIKVMAETGIDISKNFPKSIDKFINESWNYVITVCDNAKEICPVFPGKVDVRFHLPFEDPGLVTGTEEEILAAFRKTRDEIKEKFFDFYKSNVLKK